MPEFAPPWVDAAPFRAHLRHLMAVGDMSVEVVAALTGVPPRAARHLLEGRGGRHVRRISTDTARRLLQLTSADARWAGRQLVPAAATIDRLSELVAAGHPLPEVARTVREDVNVLLDLTAGRRRVCSPLLAARVWALHAAVDAREDLIFSLAS